MNKKVGLVIAELLAVLALVNIVIWWIPFNHPESFWVGYILLHLAIIEIAAGRFFSYARKNIKSRFTNFPLCYVMFAGGALLLLAGIFFIVFNAIPLKTSVLISAILIVLNLLLLVRTDIAREEVSGVEKHIKMKSFYIGSLEQTVRSMIESDTDASLKKELEKLAEDIHYSDPMSSPALASIEKELQTACGELQSIKGDPAAALDACKSLRKLVQARNEKCALLK